MKDNKDCSSKGCAKSCFVSVIAVFAFTFVYDWLVHGKLLTNLYMQAQAAHPVFRDLPEMQAMLPWCIGFHFFFALVVVSMFKNYRNYETSCATTPEEAKKCICKRGICFGLYLGLIIGLGMFSSYIWLPIPLTLAAAWFATGLLKGLGIGLALSCACKKKAA